MEDTKPQLKYNYLGKSSLKVSNICLGTSVFGPQQHEVGHVSTVEIQEGAKIVSGGLSICKTLYDDAQAAADGSTRVCLCVVRHTTGLRRRHGGAADEPLRGTRR